MVVEEMETATLDDLKHYEVGTKGQLISKAIYSVLDSPKKRTKKI